MAPNFSLLPTTFVKRIFLLLLVFVSLLSPIVLAGPITLFAYNKAEFTNGLINIIWHLWFLPFVVIFLSVLLSLLSARFFIAITWLILTLALALYVQGNFLVWDYGVLDGSEIDWSSLNHRAWIDGATWLCVFFLSYKFRNKLLSNSYLISFVLIILPSIGAISAITSHSINWKSDIKESKQIDSIASFSKDKNVLHIILDTFQGPFFAAALKRREKLTQDFAGFTYYTNTTSGFPTTSPSIPFILSGVQYDNSLPIEQFLAKTLPTSLPEHMASNGYASDVISLPNICKHIPKSNCLGLSAVAANNIKQFELNELGKLLDLAAFRAAPHFLKKDILNDGKGLIQDYLSQRKGPEGLSNSITFAEMLTEAMNNTSNSPTYKFIHLLLPHPPLSYRSDCSYYDAASFKKKKVNFKRREEQIDCSLKLALDIVNGMKSLQVFEQSMIIISADHGSPQKTLDYKAPADWPKIELALPLLLIKPFGKDSSQTLQLSSSPACLGDFFRTVSESLGIPGNFSPGENILQIGPDTTRTRLFRYYQWRNRFWGSEYLPNMNEYSINGNAQDINAWKATGNMFTAPREGK
jgi:Sulfatase